MGSSKSKDQKDADIESQQAGSFANNPATGGWFTPARKQSDTPKEEPPPSQAYSTSITPLTPGEVEEFKMVTLFDEGQIQQLFIKFKNIDTDDDGFIKKEDILLIDELHHHPLRQRIMEVLPLPKDVSFEQFLDCLSVFSNGATKDEKVRFAFKLWDTDNDGVLNSNDLAVTIDILCGGALSQTDLDFVIGKLLSENTSPSNPEGFLTLDSFQRITSDTDIKRKLTFQML
eukprot:TRINITY_DN23227_c0_g1_i1.p1 TRINITY_DN23227_c0_g1~~TRINITY_DN23227_c0_g1_i1.p1  ORF type:complete len:230 (+),score=53.95 TRINITY_DN23227_c0_g1_i1:50-739(+)